LHLQLFIKFTEIWILKQTTFRYLKMGFCNTLLIHLGSFDTNYIIFTNVEKFQNYKVIFKITIFFWVFFGFFWKIIKSSRILPEWKISKLINQLIVQQTCVEVVKVVRYSFHHIYVVVEVPIEPFKLWINKRWFFMHLRGKRKSCESTHNLVVGSATKLWIKFFISSYSFCSLPLPSFLTYEWTCTSSVQRDVSSLWWM
jgi:hypothetical protein